VSNSSFSAVIRLFTLLAIITSFFGVALGLLNYFMELFKFEDNFYNRFKVGLLTFLIPLLIVLAYPQVFIKSLAIAAAFLSLVSIIIPSLIALKINCLNNTKSINASLSVFFLLLSGIILVLLQIYLAIA